MKRLFIPLLIAFLAIFTTNASYVNDPTRCSRSNCVVSNQPKFKYVNGLVYKYKYNVDVSTNLGRKDDGIAGQRNESSLNLDAIVSISFTSACEGYLKLSEVSLSEDRRNYDPEFPDRADIEFKKSVEQYPVRFAFNDGRINEVCPHPSESIWGLNLKKGILSTLQNTMRRFDVDHGGDELDVNGICDTKYRLLEARKTSLVIRKSKNVASCTNRYQFISVIQSTSYKGSFAARSRLFREPLLSSTSECEVVVDHNVYERVDCVESHLARPLSNGRGTGARTDITSSLKLIEESDDFSDADELLSEPYQLRRRTDLLYDHADAPRVLHRELRMSRQFMKAMCRLGAADSLQQQFSEMFTKFIHSSRLLEYYSLSQLLSRADSICRTGRKHLIDALPFVGSNAALEVMKDLIIRNQVTREKANAWITGFSLIPRPDRFTLRALIPLLEYEKGKTDSQFELAYSSVVHAYCNLMEEGHCLRTPYVAKFVEYLHSKITDGCSPKAKSPIVVKQTLEALKALGNTGIETEGLRAQLRECIAGAGGFLGMETRVAAVDAHRRFASCEQTRDDYFVNLYRNFSQPTELRIASYLQTMRCPDYNVIKLIKHTLKEEEVNQVGSFVWSHLTNLLRSSSPSRIEIQSLLTDRDLGAKFNSDVRKFSRNYESSFFSDEYNVGANYQTNLIFSPSSYVPRTVTINATIDVLGESINVFEVAIRMEGMEYYAENFFGPDGPLSNEQISEHFRKLLRSLRSPEEGTSYPDQTNRLPNVIDNNFDHPRISLALKIFGNDVQYAVLDGDSSIRSALASLDPWQKFKQILSGREVNFEKAGMFLDSSYVVPTTVGLPLRLGIYGSAACNFRMSGSLDSKRLRSDGEMEVLANVKPSVSVDVTGTMSVDAFYKSTGVKLRSNIYSSGAVRGHLNLQGSRAISLNLGLPNQKVEVFSILSEVLFFGTNGPQTTEYPLGSIVAGDSNKRNNLGISTISNRTCSWHSLERLVGLKLCMDYQFPNVTKDRRASYFPLNGPTLFRVSLVKADPTANSYLFDYKWKRTPVESVIKVSFDTPGSKLQRELSAQLSFNAKSQDVSLLLKAAGTQLVAEGTYKKTDNEMLLDIGLDINGTKHLDVNVGYERVDSNYTSIYSPKLHIKINNERIAELTGTLRSVTKNNVSQCDIDLAFETKRGWCRAFGYVMRGNTGVAGNVEMKYHLEGQGGRSRNETLQLEISLSDQSSKTLTSREAKLELNSSAYPQLNVVASGLYRQALGHLEIQTEINSNPQLNDPRNKLTTQLMITYSKTYLQNKGTRLNAYVAITKPIKNLDIKVGVNHLAMISESTTTGLVRYAPGKEIILVFKLAKPRGTPYMVNAHVNFTVPTFSPMIVDVDVKEKARNEYDLDLAGTWFSGHNATAQGTYVDRSTPSTIHHMLKILVKSPSFAEDVIVNLKVYNDAYDSKVDLQMEQLNRDKYALVLRYETVPPSLISAYLECRYKTNLYTLSANVDAEREARIEVHLDRWRDVHVIGRAIDQIDAKEVAFEIKWDANRDPELKFAVAAGLHKSLGVVDAGRGLVSSSNITTNAMITYPGRLATATCLLSLQGSTNYILDARIDWNPTSTIRFTIDADYDASSPNKYFKIESQLLTPFEMWKRTSLNARYDQWENSVMASGSTYWQDSEHLILDFFGDTKRENGTLQWRSNCGMRTTVHPIKWITGNLTHRLKYGEREDTRLTINYHPDKVIDVKGSWQLDKGKDASFNLTSTLNVATPLANYRRVDATSSLQVTSNWKVFGAIVVDMDKRKYTGNLVGDVERLKESMIRFNLTTPIERFAFLKGTFGLSESNRHLVAKVIGPHGPVGVEALCQIFLQDSEFNVKLQIATPLDVLENSIVVAKFNNREADFRLGYNNMTAGFQGHWHYTNITDFHYSYIFYTPLQGLEESGVVAKVVVEPGPRFTASIVDTEFSVRVAELKIGLNALFGPKPPPFELPMKPEVTEEPEYPYDAEYDDEEPKVYWQGECHIDVAVIQTIDANLDIEQDESTYKILGSLKLPVGVVYLEDRFFMADFFTIRNDLSIDTPFALCSEIISTYNLLIDMDNSVYLMGMDFQFKNLSEWIETGINTNYTYQSVDDLTIHTIKIVMKTPLETLKRIDTKVIFELEENSYKTEVDISSGNSTGHLKAALESDEGFWDCWALVKIHGSRITVPETMLVLKKDLASKERHVEIGLEIREPVLKTYNFRGTWSEEGRKYLNASFALVSPIEALRSVELNAYHLNTIAEDSSAVLNLELIYQSLKKFQLTGSFKDPIIEVELRTPLTSLEDLKFTGKLNNVQAGQWNVNGNLLNSRSKDSHRVSGSVTTQSDVVSSATIIVHRNEDSIFQNDITLSYQRNRYDITLESSIGHLTGSFRFVYTNPLNWNTRILCEMESPTLGNPKLTYQLTTFVSTQVNGNLTIYLLAKTPLESIRHVVFNGNLLTGNATGFLSTDHRFNDDTGMLQLSWALIDYEDLACKFVTGYQSPGYQKHFAMQTFYKNPQKIMRNVLVGFDVDVDHEAWRFGGNATLGFVDLENYDVILQIKLPPPDNDYHTALVSYHANKGINDIKYAVGYNAKKSRVNYASDGSMRIDARDIDGHLRLTWGPDANQTVNNLLNITFVRNKVTVDYALITPKFPEEDTFVLKLEYETPLQKRNLIDANVYYPSTNRVGTARVAFESFANVDGSVKASTPFQGYAWVGCEFDLRTTLKTNKRYLRASWPNDTAVFNSEYTYQSERLDSTLRGFLRVEIPLSTRHNANLTYGYEKKPLVTTGHSKLTYNGEQILEGQYDSKSQSRAGFEQDRIDIAIRNVLKPVGIAYVNEYRYSAGNAGTNYPTVESKTVNVFNLVNASDFNVSGESMVKTTHEGQDVHLTAKHSNRTVQLRTDYKVLPGEFDHTTWLSLANNAWVSYHVNVVNETTEEIEKQLLSLNFAYPRNNFTLNGSYAVTTDDLDSQAVLEWDPDESQPRSVASAFRWNNVKDAENMVKERRVVLAFKHPSFQKDVTFTGEVLNKDPRDLVNARVVVDYSVNPDKLLVLAGRLTDDSQPPYGRGYNYEITGSHPKTQLDLSLKGGIRKDSFVFAKMNNDASYQRSFLPVEKGRLDARVDLRLYEVEFRREYRDDVKYLRAKYRPSYPEYAIDGAMIKGAQLNATGSFYVNVDEKLTWLRVNYTPDAVESLRMYGKIPDARNAVFDIWRTYDQDLTISDVAFYLRLNHSKLVTSTLRWRPDLKEDITGTVKNAFNDAYNSVGEDLEYWKQYVRAETVAVATEVWEDARVDMEEFLADWNDLGQLQDDLDDLKVYLNESYNGNEFYVKDIVAFGTYLLDELSLRSHIQSLPNILNEIWEIMGESGQAIRNSLLWAIETIKLGYAKLSEIVSAVLRGDSMAQIAGIVEKLVEKYDMFVKDLHVSFIKYMEDLWQKISTATSEQWGKFLKYVEPMFIKVLHYLESVVWRASKEILDFLYDRRNEIITSPYFDRFTNFTQDVDRIYKDIKSHDVVTNIRKYSAILVQIVQERYFTMVPFGKELKNIVDEIIAELKELAKLPSLRYVVDKSQQLYERAKYLYDYFEVGEQIETTLRFIHAKFTDVSRTALQAENRYREAKTKFIFDPHHGLLCLEQKLPVPWHAFNQTPEFQEIAEWRAITDVRSYFVASNTTFWTLYYQYKPYTDPSSWLPPFRAQALIAGGQHFMTFDGRYYEFRGECTYLLARDFVKRSFAILIKYNTENGKPTGHQLIVIVGNRAILLDVSKKTVETLDARQSLRLPETLGKDEARVYQEDGIVVVENSKRQFRLECNLKHDLCTLELSGWLFGKTAGLFGTMNNERSDDFLTSAGIVERDLLSFTRSWALSDTECPEPSQNHATIQDWSSFNETDSLSSVCKELFVNKTSEFNSCFNVVDPTPYYAMCLNGEGTETACTVAVAYMQVCVFQDTYLRIPDKCVRCELVNGSQVKEGEFRKLEGGQVPRSSDIVFLMEAKKCNEDPKQNLSIDQLIGSLDKEFEAVKLKDLRWSLVTFGGNGVYDEPRSVVLDGHVFTNDSQRFASYFEGISIGDGNQDVFAALRYAAQLKFRAGVSKTFVLLPCSRCEPQNQTLDYSVLHQVLLEHEVTLHILMDEEFNVEKERFGKILYGMDATKAYTKRDWHILTGDGDKRRQVKMSKSILGYCTPLALESNGTIFSGRKLRSEKDVVSRFSSVFAKRLAQSATPSVCQHCECIADNNGMTRMECIPCVYPTATLMDYDSFDEDDSMAVLQPDESDYGQLNLDNE